MRDPSAFIPARVGSKRVPGKNVRVLDGHPMIAYTIGPAIEKAKTESIPVIAYDRLIPDQDIALGREGALRLLDIGPAAQQGSGNRVGYLEHADRRRWVEEISAINQRMNEVQPL